jgi:hypothetical protein
MVEEPKEMNRYLMVELSCGETQCLPCTYPNCQRFVREQKKTKNAALAVKNVTTKTFDVKTPVVKEEGELKVVRYDEKQIDRYLLVELSCSNVQCSPCTYPNCQRFVRESRGKPMIKSIRANVIELKADQQLSKVLAEKKVKKKTKKIVKKKG